MPESIDWDERYSESDRIWSGEPNGALVAEIASVQPGRALDVGCGEGADAIWLAQHGWSVTAIDVSSVALERGRRAAARLGVDVDWRLTGLVEAALPAGGFDLVSAQYPALPRDPGEGAVQALLAAVAAGGILLFVHHTDMDEIAVAHGHEPDHYVRPTDVAAALTDGWDVVIDERRPRSVRGGAGAGHVADFILRARRQE